MQARESVLVIAGSDCSGGAGLTRDVQVLTNFRVRALCAVTAVTVQTQRHLRAIHFVPPQRVREQIRAALESGAVGAIKIGMLGNRATVAAVIQSLPSREDIPIVLDPVLAATSGGRLLDLEGEDLLRQALLPLVTLVTPNIPEAAALLRESVACDEMALLGQARRLLGAGSTAVLLKGGHGVGDVVADILLAQHEDAVWIQSPRLPIGRRGTGCALSSAIAARLARGAALVDACRTAHEYVVNELRRDAGGDPHPRGAAGTSRTES